MTGLVLEGGAFRGLFTAGVLDGLLDMNADIRYVIGVSAGSTNACSYLSRQRGRNLQIMEQFLHHPHYLGWRNFFRGRAIMDMDFVFDEIPKSLLPFDYPVFNAYPGKFLIGVYNLQTGRDEYYPHTALDEHSLLLRASCSIPLMFPAVSVQAGRYADGGLGDPIPFERSIADGNQRNLIILTQPENYRKRLTPADEWTARLYRHRYPQLSKTVLNRWQHYNSQLDACRELEKKGEALVLCPSPGLSVSRFEKDRGRLRALYQDGYRQAIQKKDELLSFIQEGNAL